MFKRFGLDYVRVAGPNQPVDVVVQLGQPATNEEKSAFIEVLAGLNPGDKVLRP